MGKAKQIAFSGMAIALSVVIVAFIKLPSLPNGGCITLGSMLVISIAAGVASGLLQFIFEPFFIHPAQFFLDYPLAFGALGLSGFFCHRKHGLALGYLAGVFGRLFFHEVSGLIFFTSYVGSLKGNTIAVWGTLLYNASYVLTEAALTLLLLSLPGVRRQFVQIKNSV